MIHRQSYFFVIALIIILAGCSKADSEAAKEPAGQTGEKNWVAIAAVRDGLIKITDDSNSTPFLPPGMTKFYWSGVSSVYDIADRIILSASGELIFQGAADNPYASKSNAIYSWKIGSDKEPRLLLDTRGDAIWKLAISQDGRHAAVISAKSSGEFFEAFNEKIKGIKELPDETELIKISEQGTKLEAEYLRQF